MVHLLDAFRDAKLTQTPHIFRIFLNLTLHSNKYNAAILEADAILPLLRAIIARAQGSVEGVFVLAKLSHESSACSTEITSSGGVHVLLTLLRDSTVDLFMRRHTMYAVYNLICQNLIAKAEIIMEGLAEVIAMLDSEDSPTVMWARCTLAYIAQSNNINIPRIDLVIANLVRCLHKPPIEQQIIVAICALAWDNDSHKTMLGNEGAIVTLVGILLAISMHQTIQINEAESEADIKDSATRALSLLVSGNDTNQERAFLVGAIPLLVSQLREKLNNPKLPTQASVDEAFTDTLSALCCLLGKPQRNDTFVQQGGIQLFSQIIAHNRVNAHTVADREDALDGLHTIASRSKAHLATITGDISVMLSIAVLMRRGSPREQTTAKSFMILVTSEGLPIPPSIVPTLITIFCADMKDEKPMSRAAVVLVRIAEDYQKHCEAITAEGVIPHAVRLAHIGSEQEKYVAAKLLLNLSMRDPKRSLDDVCNNDCVDCVLRLIRHSSTLNSDTKMYMAAFLRTLAMRASKTREMVSRADALRFLTHTVTYGNAEEQLSALRALAPLCIGNAKFMLACDDIYALVHFVSTADATMNKSVRFALRALCFLALEERVLVADLIDRDALDAISRKFEHEQQECLALSFLLDFVGIHPLLSPCPLSLFSLPLPLPLPSPLSPLPSLLFPLSSFLSPPLLCLLLPLRSPLHPFSISIFKRH